MNARIQRGVSNAEGGQMIEGRPETGMNGEIKFHNVISIIIYFSPAPPRPPGNGMEMWQFFFFVALVGWMAPPFSKTTTLLTGPHNKIAIRMREGRKGWEWNIIIRREVFCIVGRGWTLLLLLWLLLDTHYAMAENETRSIIINQSMRLGLTGDWSKYDGSISHRDSSQVKSIVGTHLPCVWRRGGDREEMRSDGCKEQKTWFDQAVQSSSLGWQSL